MRVIQNLLLKHVFDKVDIPDYIHAFEKTKSIPAMAQLHTNKRLVISIDLKDFFDTIKHKKIVECLMTLGMGEAPAKTVAELVTYKFFVPQGGLTSPKVSNMVTSMTFGPLVKRLCESKGFDVSIYADDITISTNQEGEIDVRGIIAEITNIVNEQGFKVNFRKTKVMFNKGRQYVCGVVVNAKTNLLVKHRQKLRAIVHNITVNGLDAEAAKNNLTSTEFESRIKGKINWFGQLNPELGEKLKTKLRDYLHAEGNSIEVPMAV